MTNDEKELKKALAILSIRFANCDKQALLKIILTLGAKINALENEIKELKKE